MSRDKEPGIPLQKFTTLMNHNMLSDHKPVAEIGSILSKTEAGRRTAMNTRAFIFKTQPFKNMDAEDSLLAPLLHHRTLIPTDRLFVAKETTTLAI